MQQPLDENEEVTAEDCTICLEKLVIETVFKTPCNHKFHPECIDRWRLTREENVESPACPVCRTPLDGLLRTTVPQSRGLASRAPYNILSDPQGRLHVTPATLRIFLDSDEASLAAFDENLARLLLDNHERLFDANGEQTENLASTRELVSALAEHRRLDPSRNRVTASAVPSLIQRNDERWRQIHRDLSQTVQINDSIPRTTALDHGRAHEEVARDIWRKLMLRTHLHANSSSLWDEEWASSQLSDEEWDSDDETPELEPLPEESNSMTTALERLTGMIRASQPPSVDKEVERPPRNRTERRARTRRNKWRARQ